MKRFGVIGLALLISLAFVSMGIAQDKAKAPDKPAAGPEKTVAPEKAAATADKAPAPEKAAKPKAKKAKAKAKAKGKTAGFAGTVTNYDPASKIAMVKGKGATVGFDLANARLKGYKSADDIKAGDKVVLRYAGDGVTVDKIGAAKAKKATKAKPVKKAKKAKKAKKK